MTKYAASLRGVVVSRDYKCMCSDPRQDLIKKDIQEHNIDRIIVASCSPSLHEKAFRNATFEGRITRASTTRAT